MNVKFSENFKERWQKMSLCEQLANIGSEVSRALNWKNKGREEFCEKAVNRALDLIDLTVSYMGKYSRLKEFLRAREMLVDYFYANNQFSSTQTSWRKYFDHFNYRARKDH